MKVGLFLDTHGGPYDMPAPNRERVGAFTDQLFREATAAEEAGFDSVLWGERHGRTETLFPSVLTLMAAMAVRTSRIRLGTYILILPLYNPMHVAEEVAMIDHLSRGRVILGVASGYHPGYNQFFGVPFEERGGRFEEGMEVLEKAWSGQRFTFEGKYFQYRDVLLTPTPFQKPRPELWLGGMFPKTIARAGRLGDGWCTDPFPLDAVVWREKVNLYRKSAAEQGRPSQVVLMRDAWVSPRREEADEVFLSEAIRELLFYFRFGIVAHHPDFKTEADFTPDRMRKHYVTGTPEDCIRQLEMYERDFGADYFVLRFRFPQGPEPKKVLDAVRLFGKEVLPHFRQRGTAV